VKFSEKKKQKKKILWRLTQSFIILKQTFELKLFNKVCKREMPDKWRLARALPLYQNGNKLEVINYRPISNEQSMSKVFEKLVFKNKN